MKIDISFLFAKQRSGTQLFRSILSSNDELIAVGEKFRKVFLMYWHERGQGNPEILFPKIENIELIVQDYAKHICEGKPKLMYDVKYNQMHRLNLSYQKLRGRPYLFDYIENNNRPVIHLIRKNLVETSLSILFARQTKIYKATSLEEMPKQKRFEINAERCLKITKETDSEIEYIRKQMGHYENYLEVYYEDLLSEQKDSINVDTFRDISKFMKIENQFDNKLKFVKLSKRMDESVINYEELKKVFKNTPYERFLI